MRKISRTASRRHSFSESQDLAQGYAGDGHAGARRRGVAMNAPTTDLPAIPAPINPTRANAGAINPRPLHQAPHDRGASVFTGVGILGVRP
jgi:hypothetical protein